MINKYQLRINCVNTEFTDSNGSRNLADNFNLRQTRNNTLMQIGPESLVQHKGRNGRGRTYSEAHIKCRNNMVQPVPPASNQQNGSSIFPKTKII